MCIFLENIEITDQEGQKLTLNATINNGEQWVIFGADDTVSNHLGDLLCGDHIPLKGTLDNQHQRVACVSLERQRKLLEEELENDETDLLDRFDIGRTVQDFVDAAISDEGEKREVMAEFDLHRIADKGFRQLSTGETRRLMLALAITSAPGLLVLDDPFAGLDIEHQSWLRALLERIAANHQMVIFVSREDEIPACTTHVALLDHEKISEVIPYSQWATHPVNEHIRSLAQTQASDLIGHINAYPPATHPDPLIRINDGKVEYTEAKIFRDLNWTLNNGEHWQIRGPNGCGKSTLLNLIFGDHPQCYSNDINLLGIQRGSGESVWEIKKHIGMVSSSLHLQYRVNNTAREVVVSGLFDSIGLYQRTSAPQWKEADALLDLLQLGKHKNTRFKQLSYGQQRLLIIARALIKRPPILLLDEPCQGLDILNRNLILSSLELLASTRLTQILYVTHHTADTLPSIRNFLDFVPDPEGGYHFEIQRNEG